MDAVWALGGKPFKTDYSLEGLDSVVRMLSVWRPVNHPMQHHFLNGASAEHPVVVSLQRQQVALQELGTQWKRRRTGKKTIIR